MSSPTTRNKFFDKKNTSELYPFSELSEAEEEYNTSGSFLSSQETPPPSASSASYDKRKSGTDRSSRYGSPEMTSSSPPASVTDSRNLPATLPFPNEEYKLTRRALHGEASHKHVHENEGRNTLPGVPENKQNNYFGYCILALVLCFAFLVYVLNHAPTTNMPMFGEEKESEMTGRDFMVQTFHERFKDVMTKFPTQTKHLWVTISASSKSVLKTDSPSQPGIILLAYSLSGTYTMQCISKQVSQVLRSVYNDSGVTVFHMANHLNLDAAQVKLKIDKTFNSGLASRHEHVAIVHNLEKVPGHAAMMFHSFCDNDSAPFKDAIIIFTMELPVTEDELVAMKQRTAADMVESNLQSLWEKDMGYDNTMALKSRIANNIGIVKAESTEMLPC